MYDARRLNDGRCKLNFQRRVGLKSHKQNIYKNLKFYSSYFRIAYNNVKDFKIICSDN